MWQMKFENKHLVRGVSEKTEEMAEARWFPNRDKITYQIDVFCYF